MRDNDPNHPFRVFLEETIFVVIVLSLLCKTFGFLCH